MKYGLLILMFATAIAAQAQHTGHGDHTSVPAPTQASATPYAGLQERAIKALSSQQIADLRTGKGMALALAAEQNGYPGPKHVLELAQPLGLTEVQVSTTTTMIDKMQAETALLGEAVVEAETMLERLFADQRVRHELLDQAVTQAALAHGRLRAAHLRYHLDMVALLEPEQVARYNALRGYR